MLGITMRVMRHTYPGGAVEVRDALAADWPRFLSVACPQEHVFYLPNLGCGILEFVAGLELSGLIFSGGEDWGHAPARDATEAALFAWAQEARLPVFGVCRGAQVINLLMGGRLVACQGHVAARHAVDLGRPVAACRRYEVNSFHASAIRPEGLGPGLEALALAPDGTVEAFTGVDGRITAVMWHPEREPQAAALDAALLRGCLSRGSARAMAAGGGAS